MTEETVLKRLTIEETEKCWPTCPRTGCKNFFSCPQHWGDFEDD